MSVTFTILITPTYTLHCTISTPETTTPLKLTPDHPDDFHPTVDFTPNHIRIPPTPTSTSLTFLQAFIEHPDDFTPYTVTYHGKTHSVLPEILFAIIINEYKTKIEKCHVIDATVVQTPSRDSFLADRLRVSLEAIGLRNIFVNASSFDYSEQGDVLNEILETKMMIDEHQRMIQRAKNINPNLEQKLDRFDVESGKFEGVFDEEKIQREIAMSFSLKERTEMKMTKLDNYCLFIASRYLESLDDHVNLVKTSRRMKNNLEKFHYNPISVNGATVDFFENLETLHLYEKDDIVITRNRIEFYCDWRHISFNEMEKMKKENEEKKFEFKNVIWNRNDTNCVIEKHKKENPNDANNFNNGFGAFGMNNNSNNNFVQIVIPECVKEISSDSFKMNGIKEIVITSSVKEIQKELIVNCYDLTKITLPLNETQIICGNKIFAVPDFKEDILLPESIRVINNEQINQITSLTIPSMITSLADNCFDQWNNYRNGFGMNNFNFNIQQIIIPSSVETISKNCLKNLKSLTNISLPLKESQIICGNKIFSIPHFKEDILLPDSIKIINGNEVNISNIEIPTSVTSIEEDSFSNINVVNHHMNRNHGGFQMFPNNFRMMNNRNQMNQTQNEWLKELIIPSTIKEIPKKLLQQCNNLTKITLELNESRIICGNKIFKSPHLEEEFILPNSIKVINDIQINHLSTLEIPTFVTSLSENCFDCFLSKFDESMNYNNNNFGIGNFIVNFNEINNNFQNLVIPSSIKSIPKKCIKQLSFLTNITLPLNETQVVCGNKIFDMMNLKEDILLPDSIKTINGKEVDKYSFEIPTIITSIDQFTLEENKFLHELIIPTTIKNIEKNSFEKFVWLTNITLPLNETQVVCGNKIFSIPDFKEDIVLPNSILFINGKQINNMTIEIPSSMTTIDWNYLISLNNSLAEISIPSTIKNIPNGCFIDSRYLTKLTLPLKDSQIICGNKIFSVPHFKQEYFLPKSLEIINGKKVNRELVEIPTSVTSLDEKCFNSYNYLKQITIPSTVNEIPKTIFHDCDQLSNITLPLNENQIIFGNKIFNEKDFIEDIPLSTNVKIINNKEVNITSISIPSVVTSINSTTFDIWKDYIKEISIPSTIKEISKDCFEKLQSLTNISLPLSETQVILGNKIFNALDLKEDIILPNKIQFINGKQIDISKIEIPTSVTSLNDYSFDTFTKMKQLTIPESVKIISPNSFIKLSLLEELTISSQYQLHRDRLFFVNNETLHSIILPKSMKKVNDQEIQPLQTFTIPSEVTKLSEYCFANCVELSEIKGLENVKEFGKGCFFNCLQLQHNDHPIILHYYEKSKNDIISNFHKEQLEEWTGLKCGEIIFDSEKDNWSLNESVFDHKILGKKQITFIIEDENDEIFGYYLNTEVINKENQFKMKVDDKSFQFNLKSKNNRLKQPMKFEIKDSNMGGYKLWKQSDSDLITIGEIYLIKKENRNKCYCSQQLLFCYFDYHGIENALCGKSGSSNPFEAKRIVAIQMN